MITLGTFMRLVSTVWFQMFPEMIRPNQCISHTGCLYLIFSTVNFQMCLQKYAKSHFAGIYFGGLFPKKSLWRRGMLLSLVKCSRKWLRLIRKGAAAQVAPWRGVRLNLLRIEIGSNVTAAKKLDNFVPKLLDDKMGPKMRICPTAQHPPRHALNNTPPEPPPPLPTPQPN